MVLEQFNILKTATISLTIAVLVFAKQIAFFLVEENRYFYLWTASDASAIALDVILLGICICGVSLLLGRLKLPRLTRLYNHVLVLVIGSCFLTLIPTSTLAPYEGSGRLACCWIALCSLIAFSLGYARSRLVEWMAALCLIMSPLVVILGWQIASASTWSSAVECGQTRQIVARSQEDNGKAKHPIFVFVFDEWSYKRSTRDGEFLSELPNLRRLSNESIVFQAAQSYSTRSMHSLPAILFQLNQQVIIGNGQTFWEIDKQRVPTNEVSSIFALAKQHGYYSALQGFYLPYRKMLGEQVDYCRSGCVFPKGDGVANEMEFVAKRNFQWLTDPVTDLKRKTFEANLVSTSWYDMSSRMFAESMQMIDECPANTIAFFHFPLPHGPFVFNPDASYHGPYPQGNLIAGLRGSVEDYQRHLLLQDRVVGEIVKKLRSMDRYEGALLVFTSDHEWRSDPDEREASKSWKINPTFLRVPLIIKLPGQKQRQTIDQPVKNNQVLRPVIESVLRGQSPERALQESLLVTADKRPPNQKTQSP